MRSLLLLLLLLQGVALRADHFLGGTLSHTCLGGGLYQLELVLYRDCSGVPMIPQSLQFSSTCGTSFSQNNLQPQLVEEVSPLCPAQLPNSTCNGGSLSGVRAYHYRPVVFLSPCAEWTISWSICCRDGSLNLLDAPGLYVETKLNNLVAPCADSPRYTQHETPFVCVGQPVLFHPGVVGTPGHVLRHRFIEARFASPLPLPVTYLVPHFGLQPWTGMTIDSISGTIAFTPDTQGSIVVAVQVDERDANGNWIASVMRDFRFIVTACGNTVPPASAGTLSAASGAGAITGPYSANVCTNGEVCLQAVFSDPDAGQSLTFSSNVQEVLPGAQFSVSGSNPATVTICWDATDAGAAERSFQITAMDGHCPIMGMQNYGYTLTFAEAPSAGDGGTALTCPQTAPFFLADSLGGNNPPGGSWTAPNGQPHPGLFNPATDPGGLYTYTVSGAPGCSATALVAVVVVPPDDPLCSTLGLDEHLSGPLQVQPNPAQDRLLVLPPTAWQGLLLGMYLSDMTGRPVAHWPAGNHPEGRWLELPPGLPNGTYVLHATAPGHPPVVQRIMVLR